MPNRVEPAMTKKKRSSTKNYFRLSFRDILNILVAIAVPISIGIYTVVTTNQDMNTAKLEAEEQRRIAQESLQQKLYSDFIDSIYQLYKDGELNETYSPWAFANARYRAMHRQLDTVRKAHVLQFLKEKELIGRGDCITGCEQKQLKDIIRLNGLNFDGVQLSSETGKLSQMDLRCVELDRVSFVGAILTDVDLSGTSFERSNFNGAKFIGSTLDCTKFNGTQMDGIDFSKSSLNNVEFINVDLSKTKLTEEQIQQSTFINSTMPNGNVFTKSSTTSTMKTISIDDQNTFIHKITSVATPSSSSHYNSTLHQWFAERKNISVWELIGEQLNDQDISIVRDIIKQNNKMLTLMNLSSNQIGNNGAQYLADMLQNNTELTTLDLSDNQIQSKGAQYLAATLENNTALTTLNLANNELGKDGAIFMSGALLKNTALTTLNLAGNGIGRNGALLLCGIFQKNTVLTTLNMASNGIEKDGAACFGDALQNNTVVISLDLSGNQIGENAVRFLVDILRNNIVLQKLTVLRGNNISQEVADQLRNESSRIM